MRKIVFVIFLIALVSCKHHDKTVVAESKYKKTGSIERLDPLMDSIIDKNAQPEIIAEGMDWSEGPVWVEDQRMLLFSDVPRDTVWKWTEEKGKEVYLTPSGYTDTAKRGGEMGSNGLLLDKNGALVLCQCGNRQMARMNSTLDKPVAVYISLANSYNGKKFNSPNDAVYNSKGELFFTDPPYGLEKQMEDPKKEIPFQGVYKISPEGNITLVIDSLTRPNGIAFLPGEKTMLVANSDPDKPYWYAIDSKPGDSAVSARIFLSAAMNDKTLKGLPDGMKVSSKGIVFATGPGGVWIFTGTGILLGKIRVDEATSNVALSPDEKTLYITNDMYILRLKMRK
jgi:gluconolactonase